MSLVNVILRLLPNIKLKIKAAGIEYSPQQYIQRTFIIAAILSIMVSFPIFFMADKFAELDIGYSILVLLCSLAFFYIVFFLLNIGFLDVYAKRRSNALEKDILYIGRHLMIKIKSGAPFFTSIISASNFPGQTGSFFKSIVNDVETGKPIEEALGNSVDYCPSKNMKRILREAANALKLGIDVSESLRNILEDIYSTQIEDIRKYGKKMASLTLFYMIFGIIVPLLGIVAMTIIGSFFGFSAKFGHLLFVVFIIAIMQFIFLTFFLQARPLVNT